MATTMAALPRAQRAPDMTSVFQHAPIAGLIVDASGLVSAANRAALRLLQQSESDVIGQRFNSLLSSHVGVAFQYASNAAIRFAAPTTPRRVRLVGDRQSSTDLFVAALDDGSVFVQLVESFGTGADIAAVTAQRSFRGALVELSELSHEHVDDGVFYDQLLRRAIEVVPGAQAGSILIRTPNTNEFHFVAANGFELHRLQERCLHEEEMFRDIASPTATINHDIASMELNEDQAAWLADAGRINEIVANVPAPVHIAGEPAAFISLDNFDDPDAFCNTSIEMTTVLGRLIADLIRRRQLEAELRRERESFRYQAMHDQLTGLANRRQIELALESTLEASKRSREPLALLFIDIDDFKKINDLHGHDVGDDVLVAVANALTNCARDTDLVGRWGGDEFMIIAPGTRSELCGLALAQRFRGSLADELTLAQGTTVGVNLSIGVAWTAAGAHGPEAMVRQADAALYEAKHSGKNTFRLKAD